MEVRGGLCGSVRLLMATEEHGAGRQMVRYRLWPVWNRFAVLIILLFAIIAAGSATDGAWVTSAFSALFAILASAWLLVDSGYAFGTVSEALQEST